MEKQKTPHRSGLAVSLLCAAVLAACASVGINDNLEAARAEVNSASADPDVVSRAPLELKNAQEALNRADNLNRGRESIAEVNHHAYLAAVRAQTAKDLARSRRDTDEMTRMQAEVDRLRLASRTREANVARADASAARTDAAIAREQAQVAAQQAAAASAQAQSATQQADVERARAAQASAEAAEARDKLRVVLVELQGRETERGLLVTLGDVLFATGRAELLPNAGPRMDKLAAFLNQFPEKSLLIEGYTDSTGSDALNQDLSMRRADAVRAALAQRGVGPTRMATRGYGEGYPIASNTSAEGRAMNRRVEVVVTDDRGNLKPRA
jgi:outer membrane protein OmpA-like peptidoglycan-associated protein